MACVVYSHLEKGYMHIPSIFVIIEYFSSTTLQAMDNEALLIIQHQCLRK